MPLAFPSECQEGPVECPFCGEASDCFGDHVLCCNKAEFCTRHQVLVKCLTAFAAAAGLHVANEVQIDGRQRPADIFVDRWTTADPAAIDVTVSHPLAPSLWLNVRSAKELANTKEKQKIAKYAHLIAEKQLHFIPVAITTLGALGPQATQFVDDAADFYTAKCAVDRGLCRKQLVERVQVALLHEIGKRLLAGNQAGEGGVEKQGGVNPERTFFQLDRQFGSFFKLGVPLQTLPSSTNPFHTHILLCNLVSLFYCLVIKFLFCFISLLCFPR